MGAISDVINKAMNYKIVEGTEVIQKFKEAALATGKQTKTLALTGGTNRTVIEVTITVGTNGNEWGADGYVQIHRTDTTPDESIPSTTLLGEVYLNTSNVILLDQTRWSTEALKIVMDHNAGVAKDVRINVRYFHKA